MNFQLPASVVQPNFDLSAVSSMRTGGKAAYALFPENTEMLVEALRQAEALPLRTVVAGNTSNLLFPDDASELCVIFTKKITAPLSVDGSCLSAPCGMTLPVLSKEAQSRGLSGLEFACGIPGTVGGGIFMNAGAYGGEMAKVLTAVTAYDRSARQLVTLSREECAFAYRQSLFKTRRELIVLEGHFLLTPDNSESIAAVCREALASRRQKQPLEYPSCGSAFKRPEGYFAGKLIEDCGLKGFSVGGAAVSEKHAGFIINRGRRHQRGCKATDSQGPGNRLGTLWRRFGTGN